MEPLHILTLGIDQILIAPYRLVADPALGFTIGTFFLVLWCVVLGEVTGGLAYLFNRRHYAKQMEEMVHMHNLSIRAIRHKDKQSYKATNRWANEYFGKVFFAQAALFAVTIWPVPFALAWMGSRFGDVPFHIPVLDVQVSYVAIFLAFYIPERILFSKIKYKLPFFRWIGSLAADVSRLKEPILSWSDLGVRQEREQARSKESSAEDS